MDGWVNVLKPPGMTAFDVVSFLRRILAIQKIGHAGTLDPGAAGVLPLAIGRATRLIKWADHGGKAYRVEMKLGKATSTQDAFGDVLAERDFSFVSQWQIKEALDHFVGFFWQTPPMVSAVHVQGKRLYQWAREGIEVSRPQRLVKVDAIRILAVDLDRGWIRFDVQCAPGTYVRTICHDVGEKLGCGAYMSFLVRLLSGPFQLEDSWTLEEVRHSLDGGDLTFLRPMEAAVLHLPEARLLNARAALWARNGRQIPGGWWQAEESAPGLEGGEVRVYDPAGRFLAVAKTGTGEEGINLNMIKVFG